MTQAIDRCPAYWKPSDTQTGKSDHFLTHRWWVEREGNGDSTLAGDSRERLYTLCRDLGRRFGVFGLDERRAAKLVGCSKTTARNRLRQMVADGVLTIVAEGKYGGGRGKGKATTYRFHEPEGEQTAEERLRTGLRMAA